ncbi:hypothetical protein GVN21_02890 [Caulobacter sp. SLTY]|uniref:cbb3-type cytochrome c oxidase subunit I n=1 Tax=Caulobacter sp. SLTY TaxID=2683262 RepID=UPI00141318FD|nr:cbb3-type cytochrome c oxidase subunit I [Caulobacter sp. SLTY]NBB14300.1 hypothetical protein [Caulobacter sp. SLTY]
MPRVSVAFFTAAALAALCGMAWGTHMGMTGDHSLSPAHAHLNLLGWVTLSIMGGFYALPGVRYSPKLAWANFGLSTIGAVLMGVLLPQVLMQKMTGQVMMAAELPTILGLLLFIAAVVGNWRKAPA